MKKVIGMNCLPIYGTDKNIKTLPALANYRRLFGNIIQRVPLFVIIWFSFRLVEMKIKCWVVRLCHPRLRFAHQGLFTFSHFVATSRFSIHLPFNTAKIEFKNRWDVQKMIYNGVFLIIRGEFLLFNGLNLMLYLKKRIERGFDRLSG